MASIKKRTNWYKRRRQGLQQLGYDIPYDERIIVDLYRNLLYHWRIGFSEPYAEIARVMGLTARTVYEDVLQFGIPLEGNDEWCVLGTTEKE
jgi:hypothetical protein